MKRITESAFWEIYKPIKNFLVEGASFDDCMFETFGEELEVVKKAVTIQKVWTILDVEGELQISPGFSLVNRIGYLITERPWESLDIEVVDDNSPAYDVGAAKDFLRDQGYYVDNLWSVEDVYNKEGGDTMDSSEAQDILDRALTRDWLCEHINAAISEELEAQLEKDLP